MPGGGELALVCYGELNSVVSGSPSYTNFYKAFKHYTHFSQESISIPLDGPNELVQDSPVRVRAFIPRNAALLKNLTLVFQLPDIYSKGLAAFRWIPMLGALIIDSAAIFVNGIEIQEFPGEWIAARASTDMDVDTFRKWSELIGNVPELYAPEKGVNAYGVNGGEYPHTVADPSGNPTAPSIRGREIRVPLPFWFAETPGCALPLTALQLAPVEVQITLRPLEELYRLMDTTTNREPVRNNTVLSLDATRPTSYDPTTPTAYDNLTLQNSYTRIMDTTGRNFRDFLVDVGVPTPSLDSFALNAHLEGTFIYLTKAEETLFVSRELSALVHQVQVFRAPALTRRTRIDLDAHGLATRLIFYGRRSDAIERRNDYVNLSNWKRRDQVPYWPLAASGSIPNAGRLIDYYAAPNLITGAKLVGAGTDLSDLLSSTYLEVQTAFEANSGSSSLVRGPAHAPQAMGPLYHLPFALHASDHHQPSGSLNMSRLREIQLDVALTPLDPFSPYQVDVTVFVESLNIITFTSGLAGLKFAI